MPKKPKRPQGFADLADRDEDSRIKVIGDLAMTGKVVAFVVDVKGEDGFENADRYVKKLMAKYPKLHLHFKGIGPTPEMVTVKVGLEAEDN